MSAASSSLTSALIYFRISRASDPSRARMHPLSFEAIPLPLRIEKAPRKTVRDSRDPDTCGRFFPSDLRLERASQPSRRKERSSRVFEGVIRESDELTFLLPTPTTFLPRPTLDGNAPSLSLNLSTILPSTSPLPNSSPIQPSCSHQAPPPCQRRKRGGCSARAQMDDRGDSESRRSWRSYQGGS